MTQTTETTAGNAPVSIPTPPAKDAAFRSLLSEDWVAFVIGAVVIACTLLIAAFSPGFVFQAPVYQWADANTLFTKVLAPANLAILGLIGVIFFALALVAVALLGGNPRRFVTGFAIV